jgi:hypothetical protein
MAAAKAFRNDEAIDPAASHGPTPEEVNSDADREHVEEMMRAGEQVPLPVLVALVNTGVVKQSTMVFGGGTHVHDVSPFDRQLLRDAMRFNRSERRTEQHLDNVGPR